LVGEKPGRKKEHRLSLQELSQLVLELGMQLQGAVEQPGAGAARSIFSRRLACRLDHPLVLRQAEVVVRADHDLALTPADYIVAVGLLNASEVGIKALSPCVGTVPVLPTFLI
jgi:hypothetical protein